MLCAAVVIGALRVKRLNLYQHLLQANLHNKRYDKYSEVIKKHLIFVRSILTTYSKHTHSCNQGLSIAIGVV